MIEASLQISWEWELHCYLWRMAPFPNSNNICSMAYGICSIYAQCKADFIMDQYGWKSQLLNNL